MKIKILFIALAITFQSFSQTIYKVQPGTKGNEIKLTVANVSETDPATNVNVLLTRKSSSLNFSKEEERGMFEAKQRLKQNSNLSEQKCTINKKDTIDFVISSQDGIMMTKQFHLQLHRTKRIQA